MKYQAAKWRMRCHGTSITGYIRSGMEASRIPIDSIPLYDAYEAAGPYSVGSIAQLCLQVSTALNMVPVLIRFLRIAISDHGLVPQQDRSTATSCKENQAIQAHERRPHLFVVPP